MCSTHTHVARNWRTKRYAMGTSALHELVTRNILVGKETIPLLENEDAPKQHCGIYTYKFRGNLLLIIVSPAFKSIYL